MPACPSCGEDNPQRAKFCWSCGAALTETAPSTAEERKVVSILFVDLVGFTAASENADPEDVRARLRPYHARVKQEIERFGGTVEKFVGDAVMAVFGAPVAHEDDAERAVNAALRILAAIDELNAEHPDLELAVREAVNTGEAVVTVGARPAEGEAMVAGDVVNTAARLQQAAPVGGIVVGESTFRATRDLFEYEALDPVTVKGKVASLSIWRATAARRRFGVDAEPSVRTPLIGRDDDLTLLQSTYTRTLRESSIQLVTVAGEPGVGKTRLVAEFRAWVDDRPELVFWRQGRSLPYGEGITYWALGEMVKAQAGILESDTPEVASTKLDVAVQEAAEDPSERDWLKARLAPLVGAGAAEAGEREESFTAWRRFVEGIAAQRPLVLLFEDLHWADDALLAFIEHLVDWSSGVPLLVLCTARPELYERHAGWGGGKRNSNTISLSPLGTEDTARLLAALLRKAVLPAETQQTLLEHAGGNPLYAEEFVRMLSDQGVLTEDGELRDGRIAVPDTVQALIAARLDTLAPERKALLHDAAVVGKVFWAGIVAAMGGRDEAIVREGLHELARKELVRSARMSSVKDQAEYSFWHLLVRDVAYGQIPRADRARKHVAAAQWIESMAGERVSDHAELLAYHYEQALELARAAGDVDEATRLGESARRFLVLAGDRAMSLDLTKSASYYRHALDLYGKDELERARVLIKAAGTFAGSLEEQQRDLEEALTIFRTHRDELGLGGTLVRLGHAAFLRGHSAEGERLLAEGIEVLEQHPPGEELAHAYTRKAGHFALRSRPHDCLAASERALALADDFGLPVFESRVLQFRGIARCDLGDFGGIEDIERGLELAREIGHLPGVGIGYSNLGSTIWLARSPAESLDVYRAGIDFTLKRGMPGTAMWLKAELTWVLYDLGRWDEVLRLVEETIESERERGQSYAGIIAIPQKTIVQVHRSRAAEEASLADEVVARAREVKDPQALVPALAAAAFVAQARGDLAAAAAFVRELDLSAGDFAAQRARFLPELVAIALAAGESELAHTLIESIDLEDGRTGHSVVAARAVFAEVTGTMDEALALYEQAVERWASYGFVLGHARSLHGGGRCLLALGRRQEAASRLGEARDIYESLGARRLVSEVDEALARATSVSA